MIGIVSLWSRSEERESGCIRPETCRRIDKFFPSFFSGATAKGMGRCLWSCAASCRLEKARESISIDVIPVIISGCFAPEFGAAGSVWLNFRPKWNGAIFGKVVDQKKESKIRCWYHFGFNWSNVCISFWVQILWFVWKFLHAVLIIWL